MEYQLAEVLSVTTGRLLCPFDNLHKLLTELAGEPVFTHALPRVCEEAAPLILARYPALADVSVPEFSGVRDRAEAEIASWLEGLYADGLPRTLELDPMAAEDHTSIDPISELKMMRPDLPIVAIVVDEP